MANDKQVYSASKGGKEVLRFMRGPGSLVSKAAKEDAPQHPKHPFLAGASYDAKAEDAIKACLEKSKDFDDFKARLEKAGFKIEETSKKL